MNNRKRVRQQLLNVLRQIDQDKDELYDEIARLFVVLEMFTASSRGGDIVDANFVKWVNQYLADAKSQQERRTLKELLC